MTNKRLYFVRRSRAKKLWLVYYPGIGFPRFPRFRQLGKQLVCLVKKHDWSEWGCDDEDGPMEYVGREEGDDVYAPLCSRPARPGELAARACLRCSAVETRIPAETFQDTLCGYEPKLMAD